MNRTIPILALALGAPLCAFALHASTAEPQDEAQPPAAASDALLTILGRYGQGTSEAQAADEERARTESYLRQGLEELRSGAKALRQHTLEIARDAKARARSAEEAQEASQEEREVVEECEEPEQSLQHPDLHELHERAATLWLERLGALEELGALHEVVLGHGLDELAELDVEIEIPELADALDPSVVQQIQAELEVLRRQERAVQRAQRAARERERELPAQLRQQQEVLRQHARAAEQHGRAQERELARVEAGQRRALEQVAVEMERALAALERAGGRESGLLGRARAEAPRATETRAAEGCCAKHHCELEQRVRALEELRASAGAGVQVWRSAEHPRCAPRRQGGAGVPGSPALPAPPAPPACPTPAAPPTQVAPPAPQGPGSVTLFRASPEAQGLHVAPNTGLRLAPNAVLYGAQGVALPSTASVLRTSVLRTSEPEQGLGQSGSASPAKEAEEELLREVQALISELLGEVQELRAVVGELRGEMAQHASPH